MVPPPWARTMMWKLPTALATFRGEVQSVRSSYSVKYSSIVRTCLTVF
jgi:hypothetical protein